MQHQRTHLLFVCSRNQWRSPTGEQIYARDSRVAVRSCGVSMKARRRLREEDLDWADVVLVMEHAHRQRILQRFPDAGRDVAIEVLDIPDDYGFMDPELQEMLRGHVEALLENL
ncbi:MAG: low molecular weight protein tyrosine phosphatase family protein [Planctomycetota bacterium]